MSGWIMWVIAACVFGVGEALTKRFLVAPFAIGAVLAAIVDVAGPGGIASWAAFLVVSLLLLFAVRPIARSRMQTRSRIHAGKAALVGKNAIVLEAIANDEGVGCVKIDGQVWTARALDDDVIKRGTQVEVVEIKGATAVVTATDRPGPE